jgi:hypothetical protein
MNSSECHANAQEHVESADAAQLTDGFHVRSEQIPRVSVVSPASEDGVLSPSRQSAAKARSGG